MMSAHALHAVPRSESGSVASMVRHELGQDLLDLMSDSFIHDVQVDEGGLPGA